MFKQLFFSLIIVLVFTTCKNITSDPDIQNLKIHMHYGFRNEVNTFTNKLQKDLVLDGIVTTDFYFTEQEQDRIIEKLFSIEFFGFADTIRMPANDTISYYLPNPGMQFIRANIDCHDKTTCWYYPLPNTSQARVLLELYDLIIEIVESKPEYQNLPEAHGGYL